MIKQHYFLVKAESTNKFNTVESVLDLVESNGFKINEMGSRVKGSRKLFLEQGSTMANLIPVKFWNGTIEIPSCYYEFALRYKMENGELYKGFVETSANKIFESTNKVG